MPDPAYQQNSRIEIDGTIIKLPFWVNWLAQDEDGAWWGYEATPNQQHNGWYENEVGMIVRLYQGKPNDLWHETLRRIK